MMGCDSDVCAVSLDEVVYQVDDAEGRTCVVDFSSSKHDLICTCQRNISCDEAARCQQLEKSGTLSREIVTVRVRLLWRIQRDKEDIEPRTKEGPEVDLSHSAGRVPVAMVVRLTVNVSSVPSTRTMCFSCLKRL